MGVGAELTQKRVDSASPPPCQTWMDPIPNFQSPQTGQRAEGCGHCRLPAQRARSWQLPGPWGMGQPSSIPHMLLLLWAPTSGVALPPLVQAPSWGLTAGMAGSWRNEEESEWAHCLSPRLPSPSSMIGNWQYLIIPPDLRPLPETRTEHSPVLSPDVGNQGCGIGPHP